MAEVGRFFDAVSYGEGDQAEVQSRMVADGVVSGVGGQLAVISGGAGLANVATGEAFIQGFWYKNDAPKLLPITANASATARVDLVVLRLDRVDNTLLTVIKEGVLGAGAPALTQIVGGDWEQPLASISTVSGVSTYTDLRIIPRIVYNPMTTAGDIVVGGASGVPTRQAKGANNRVFGVDASGVLGYRQIVDADVATGANIAWEKLKGQGYAMTVPGSVDGTNIQAQYIETMMRDNMMPGSKIVDQSIPAGKLATGSVTNDEIQPNTIHPGRLTSWSGSTYGNHLLYDVAGGGGISVAKLDNAFITDNTISGGKLQDNTIPGSKFTAESISYVHIIDGTIRAYEIGGRAITAYGGMQGNFGAIGAGAWSYTNHIASVAGLYPGASLTYVIFSVGVQANTVNALLGVGVGVDSTAGPTWYCHGSQPTANGVVNMVVSGLHLATGSAHNYYGLVYTNVGTIAAYGVCQIWAVSFHR